MNKRYPSSMQNCLDDFKKSWEDLDKLSKLNENWEKLIGLELSRACKPLKIEQKTLVINVNHPQSFEHFSFLINANIEKKLKDEAKEKNILAKKAIEQKRKLDQARILGTKIITLEDLKKLLNQTS